MLLKKPLIALTICGFGAAFIPSANAVSLGLNVAASNGDVEENGFSNEIDNDAFEVGLALDTGRGGSFNYRLNLNLVSGELSDEVSADYKGFAINNSFGFRIAQGNQLRFWAGPSIDIQFLEIDDGLEQEFTSVGVGPVLGLDVATGPASRLSVETGVKLRLIEFEDDFNRNETDLEGYDGFIRLTILFGSHGSWHQQPRRTPRQHGDTL